MPLLNIGQPLGGVMQYAYTVPNIEEAIHDYVKVCGIGPWYVVGPFVPPEGMYRGRKTQIEVTLAVAFSGHTQIELVQQHNDVPSVFKETIQRTGGHGFHHFGIVTGQFDADLAHYRSEGFELVFSDRIFGSRIAYFDTTRKLPGMTELIEHTPGIEAQIMPPYVASLAWDGSEPIRRVGPIVR